MIEVRNTILPFLVWCLATSACCSFSTPKHSTNSLKIRVGNRIEIRWCLSTPTLLRAVEKNEDFPPPKDDEYTGDIDWDEEWKKVVKGEGQPRARPSGDPKSELERKALAAQRQAEETMFKMKSTARRSLNFNSLKGDWKVSPKQEIVVTLGRIRIFLRFGILLISVLARFAGYFKCGDVSTFCRRGESKLHNRRNFLYIERFIRRLNNWLWFFHHPLD